MNMSLKYAGAYGKLKGSILGIIDEIPPSERTSDPYFFKNFLLKVIEECDEEIEKHKNDEF